MYILKWCDINHRESLHINLAIVFECESLNISLFTWICTEHDFSMSSEHIH